MKKEELEKLQEIRFKEKDVRLCNRDIIAMGYFVSDVIKPLSDNKVKLPFDVFRCYFCVFYLVKRLLDEVEPEYLELHDRVHKFFDQDLEEDEWHWDTLRLYRSGCRPKTSTRKPG